MAASLAYSNTGLQNGIQLILEAHRRLHDTNMQFATKTSHNELERGRRAHLRKHMEELKGRLNRIPPGTRLTTLVILRASKEQIRANRLRNAQLHRLVVRLVKEYNEAVERHRYLAAEVENVKNQLRRIRCSGSECSMATTVSDECEVGSSSTHLAPGLSRGKMVGLPHSHPSIRHSGAAALTAAGALTATATPGTNGNNKVVHFSVHVANTTNKKQRVDSGYGTPDSPSSAAMMDVSNAVVLTSGGK